MGFTINNEPNIIFFAKNYQAIFGKVDTAELYTTAGATASVEYKFPNAAFGATDQINIVVSNYDGTGIAKTFSIKKTDLTAPEDNYGELPAGSHDDVKSLYEAIQRIPYLNLNYLIDFKYYPSTTLTGIKLTAKTIGADYNIDITGGFASYNVSNKTLVAGVNATYNENLYLKCTIFQRKRRYINAGGAASILTQLIQLAELKAFVDANGSFYFDLQDAIKSLQPYIFNLPDFSSDTATTLTVGNPNTANAEIKILIELLNANTTTLLAYEYDGYAILGAIPFFRNNKDINTSNNYFGDINRRIFSNRPRTLTFSTEIFFADFYIDKVPFLRYSYGTLTLYFDDNTTATLSITPRLTVDKLVSIGILAFTFEKFKTDYGKIPHKISYKYYNLDSLKTPYNSAGQTAKTTEQLTILIDKQKHHTNNYFRFFNTVGGNDTVWLHGKLEAEIEPEFETYEQTATNGLEYQQNNSNNHLFRHFELGKDNIIYKNNFKINTGFKTVEEIQWLTEMLGSELVYWYTEQQWKQFINDYNNNINNTAYDGSFDFQIIIIKQDSVQYYDGEHGLQAMEFEFELASKSAAPETDLIKNALATTFKE